MFERKQLTLAQLEKVVGKNDFYSYVGDLVIKQKGKPTLVIESDKRDNFIVNDVKNDFNVLD